MDTLKTIFELIRSTEDSLCDIYDRAYERGQYKKYSEFIESDEYKIYRAKVSAYYEVYDIVKEDLQKLRKVVTEMVDL